MSHRGEPALAPFWQGTEAGCRSQFGQEILTVRHLEVPARCVGVNVLLSRDVGHGDEKVVTNLEVGEQLEERRDKGMRRAELNHPRQGGCVVSKNMYVGKVARSAGHKRCYQSQGSNCSKKFFDIYRGVLVDVVEIQIEETRG